MNKYQRLVFILSLIVMSIIATNCSGSSDESAESTYNKGIEYVAQKQFDRAIGEFTKCVELAPDFTMVYLARGIAYAQTEQYDLAIADYTQFVQRDTELDDLHHSVYNDRGWAYGQLGQFRPNSCQIYCRLGRFEYACDGSRRLPRVVDATTNWVNGRLFVPTI